MANTTYALLNAVRSALGWEDRIPEINRNSLHNLTNLAPDELNEFTNVLVKIVKQEIYTTTFDRADNPFADFFREMLPAGYAIEDLYVDLITGAVPAWNDNGSEALSRKKPSVTAIYHKENYEMQYKTSTSYPQLKNAFLSVEGIDNFIATINATLYSSCEYDIYLQCIELLSTAFHNGAIKGKYGYTIANEAGIKALLKDVKNTMKEFTFMNNEYNAMGFSTRSRKEDVVLVIRSDVRDTIDVDYLAGVFNLSKVDLESRIIEVPKNYGFGTYGKVDGNEVYAMVLDKRFMKVIPTLYEGSAIMNPASLVTNTFLTTMWVFSYANFINAVAFVGGNAPTVTVSATPENKVVVSSDSAGASAITTGAVNSTAYVTEKSGLSKHVTKVSYSTPEGYEVVVYEGASLATDGAQKFILPAYNVALNVTVEA